MRWALNTLVLGSWMSEGVSERMGVRERGRRGLSAAPASDSPAELTRITWGLFGADTGLVGLGRARDSAFPANSHETCIVLAEDLTLSSKVPGFTSDHIYYLPNR